MPCAPMSKPRPPLDVHFTTGAPYMAGHEVDLYAEEWFDELTRWAA